MSNDQKLTYEEATGEGGVFSPWFTDGAIPVGDRVTTPREAAVKAILAAVNAPKGTKGVIRIVVTTAEEKRLTRCYIEAMLAEPRLKGTVKRMAPDAIHLHGGLRIELDLNGVRLVSDAVATITVDPTADAAIGTIWWESDTETREQCAERHGFAAADVPRLVFIRWLAPGEGKVEKIEPTPDGRIEAGPPPEAGSAEDALDDRKTGLASHGPDPEAIARYNKGKEDLERERINEQLRAGYRKMVKF